jgi:polyribonucleotide nucleotidyltransferase
VESVEDVLNKGDEVSGRVDEVDRERGRIGLRLAHDPDVAGKSVEELAGVGSGGGGGGRPPREGSRRNGREGSERPRRDGERGSRPRARRDRDRD